MSIRDNVKRLCVLHGITQKQLAQKIGITDSAMNINLGRKDPKFSSVKRIADALNVSIDLLTSDNIDERLKEEELIRRTDVPQDCTPRQGLFCPHCGKPLTLFVKAEEQE